jgi:6-phosphogluconolactonase
VTGPAPSAGRGLPRLLVGADPAGATLLAASEVARRARGAIAARGRFVVALSGGSTPRRLHALLAAADGPFSSAVDWSRVHVVFGDERCVPPDHPDSNYRMARETLLDRVPIPPHQVWRFRGEDPDPERAAAAYAGALQSLFPAGPVHLDLVLLGLGPDGHVASLFPGTAVLDEAVRLAAAPFVERLRTHRLTLTFPVLRMAGAVLLLATGRDKAAPAAAVLAGPGPLPAQRIGSVRGDFVVVLDAGAARQAREPPARKLAGNAGT